MSCQTKEDKANKLIKENMYKTLYDFASYEPIETIIDSAFTSIYRDSSILHKAHMIDVLLDLSSEYLEKAKDSSSSMEIWSDSYSYSSYGRSKYNSARDEVNEFLGKSKNYLNITYLYQDSIKIEVSNFTKTFIGWQANHKFRCKTKGGSSSLADYIYVFDKEFKKILYYEDTDDEKVKTAKKLIDEMIQVK
jgi:hypothetical protein